MLEQRQQHKTGPQDHYFTASEVAEFEYCPLAWWHERFEPEARADTEELFARLVELEHDHDQQAPALPEYRMIEQLLVRRGAFEDGLQQHHEHAEEVEALQEGVHVAATPARNLRLLTLIAAALFILALLMIVAAILVRQ